VRIDFYCAGICRDDGQPTQIAGCGIIVVFTDDHDRVQSRTFSYGLGNSSQSLAGLQAIRLALASVKSSFRSNTSVLHTTSSHVIQVLCHQGGSQEHPDEIVEARKWFGYYNDISVVLEDRNHDLMIQARKLAKVGLNTQERSDSGTEEFDTIV
jgi:ribonuclease HI